MTAGNGIVDAYFYLKTPGESDGCTQALPDGTACPRFDVSCGSKDSIGSRPGEPRAPEAGGWFDYQVRQLAEFADFGDERKAHQLKPGSPAQVPAGTAAPARAVNSRPEVQPSQSSIGGSCCWASGCAPSASFCSESQSNCVNGCKGQWHSAEVALTALDAPANPTARVGRHGRLRARRENVLLQRLGKLKRYASAESSDRELHPGSDEL